MNTTFRFLHVVLITLIGGILSVKRKFSFLFSSGSLSWDGSLAYLGFPTSPPWLRVFHVYSSSHQPSSRAPRHLFWMNWIGREGHIGICSNPNHWYTGVLGGLKVLGWLLDLGCELHCAWLSHVPGQSKSDSTSSYITSSARFYQTRLTIPGRLLATSYL